MQRFSATGTWQMHFGHRGWGADLSGLNWPRDIAIEQSDPHTVRTAAHTLKGMVGFFAVPEATAVARAIEKNAENGELGDAANLADRLTREIAALEAGLAQLLGETRP